MKYRREAVIEILEDELKRSARTPDKEHAEALAKWEAAELDRINAEHEAHRILKRIGEASSTGEVLELVAPKTGSQWGGRGERFKVVLEAANVTLPAKPTRTPSARERTVANVIALIKGSPDEFVTVSDLRAFGALPLVSIVGGR